MTVEIVAGAVQLRPWHVDDAPELLPAMDDPDIALWNPGTVEHGRSLDGARRYIAGRTPPDGSKVSWAVRDATSGALLGQVTLHHLGDAEHRGAEIGYWVLPQARGRGVGTTAVTAAAGYAFGALGIVRIELFHAVENLPSCALATRAGFAYEGTHRLAHRYGDGRWHDEHSHARLATDAVTDAAR